MFQKFLEKAFYFIDYYIVYTAHPIKPPKRKKGKDNTDREKKQEFREQAVILKQIILERELTLQEKEQIMGKSKGMTKEEVISVLKSVDKKPK